MKTYMEHNPKNIEPAFDTMAGSGYYPNYNIRGLTDDTCSGKALRIFIFKGTGNMYYKLLYNKYKMYLQFFVEMVIRDIDTPI